MNVVLGRRLRWAAIILASVLGAAACQSLNSSEGEAQGPRELGNNLIGEPCRLTPVTADATSPAGSTAFDVFCGAWEAPSAHIVRVQTREDVAAVADSAWWRRRIETTAHCQPASGSTDNHQLITLNCGLRRGGWPYLAQASRVGDDVFLADGIPASRPAIDTAVRALASGEGGSLAPTGDAGSLKADGTNGSDSHDLYSAGDLTSYRRILAQAQQYNYQGQHAEAARLYREALALQQRVMASDTGGSPFLLMHLALELSNQERFKEADALFDRAGKLMPTSLDPTDEPRWISYRAIHFANQKRYVQAVRLARQASEMRLELARTLRPDLFRRLEGESDDQSLIRTGVTSATSDVVIAGGAETALGDVVQSRSVEAAMLIPLGRLDEATVALTEAERILEAEPRIPLRWRPQILVLKARIAEQKGDLAAAERLYIQGIDEQRAIATDTRSEALALLALGRVYAAENHDREAFATYVRGFAIIEKRGRGLRVDEALPFFRLAAKILGQQTAPAPTATAGKANAIGNALDSNEGIGRSTPATVKTAVGLSVADVSREVFQAMQVIRGTVTGQTIALAAARLSADEEGAGHLIRDLQDARRTRDALNQAMTRAEGDPATLPIQVAALEEKWMAANNNVVRLEQDVQSALPRYNQLVDTPLSLSDALSALDDDEAIVQILPGESGTVGIFIDRNGLIVYDCPLNEDDVREFVAKLRRPVDVAPGSTYDVQAAYNLYQRLFGPVAERIARIHHLITVPGGALSSLPFEILVVQPPTPVTNGDYTGVAWMVRDHALSVSPSVQSFLQARTNARNSEAPYPFIGFGDFIPNRDAAAMLVELKLPPACRDEIEQVSKMAPLPGTADEVRAIAAAMVAGPGSIHLGPNFTEHIFKTAHLSDYRVIYLATHALLPQHLDCWSEPLIVMSKPAEGDEGEDGLLMASEITQLRLDADLVVLSACNTGGSDVASGGESLSGLARAFFYAGARSVVVSHWQIPDEPTVRLMVGMFEAVRKPRTTIADALRQGQMILAQDKGFSHPVFWGAFSVVGDGDRSLQPAQARAELLP